MLAYKNDTKLKTKFIKEIKWHQDQDKIIKGTYQEGSNGDFRGCAVGCSIHSLNRMKSKNFATNNHALYETELGIPEWLARLEDTIFEGLPTEEAKKWPLKFSKAIPVGVNLQPVKWKFSAYLMKENIDRVLSLDISDDLKEEVVKAIRGVLSVHEEAIKTGKWDESVAWSAAWSVAWLAAKLAAWSVAWSVAYERYADKLIKLLKASK